MTAQEIATKMHKFGRTTFNRWAINGATMLLQQAEQIETERMKLVACGVVALADTPDSARRAREMHADYRSASLDDVIRRVDECMALRSEVQALKADAERYRWLKANSTLGIKQNGSGWNLNTQQCAVPARIKDVDAIIDAAIDAMKEKS